MVAAEAASVAVAPAAVLHTSVAAQEHARSLRNKNHLAKDPGLHYRRPAEPGRIASSTCVMYRPDFAQNQQRVEKDGLGKR